MDQVRTTRQRLGILAQGGYKANEGGYVRGWSRTLGTNAWFEPISYVGMIQPYCLEEAWQTTNTGNYARLGLSNFGLSAGSGGWVQGSINADRMVNAAGMGSAAISSSTYGPNQGFYFSFHNFDGGPGDAINADCGWGSGGAYTSGVALRFLQGGKVQVWKDGVLGGNYSIGNKSGTRTADFSEYILLPFGRRELLVYSITAGDGFIHLFDDLDADHAPYNEITPATNFWFKKPTGSADFEVARLKFPTSASLYSTTQAFAESVKVSDTAEAVESFGSTLDGTSAITVSIVNTSGGAFSTGSQARIKFALVGDGYHTPFVYAGLAGYAGLTAETPSDELDVTDNAQEVKLNVPESCANMTFSFIVRDPEALEDATIYTGANRPFRAILGGHDLFEGRTEPPKDARIFNEEAWKLQFECRSPWKSLEKFRFRDPYPLDDLTITNALKFVAKQAGWSGANVDIQNNTFKLPAAERPSVGEWAACIEVGDTAADWFDRIIENYAAVWAYGFAPKDGRIVLRAGEQSYWSSEPEFTLYDSTEEALAAGIAADEVRNFLIRDYTRSEAEIEATEVRVTGYDPVAGRAIQAFYKNSGLEDPTLTAGARPAGWVGENWAYALADPILTTQDACNRAVTLLANRLCFPRVIHQFECEFLRASSGRPLWQCSLVNLKRRGKPLETVRINTLDATFGVYDEGSNFISRPATYTAVSGAGAYIGNDGYGLSIAEIRSGKSERSLITKTRGGEKGRWLLSQIPKSVVAVTL